MSTRGDIGVSKRRFFVCLFVFKHVDSSGGVLISPSFLFLIRALNEMVNT